MSKTEKAFTTAVDHVATASIQSKAPTKSAIVLTLLQRKQGATLAEIVNSTGWRPHTARAMLTGLRKKGHGIERGKRGDISCYHLRAEA